MSPLVNGSGLGQDFIALKKGWQVAQYSAICGPTTCSMISEIVVLGIFMRGYLFGDLENRDSKRK